MPTVVMDSSRGNHYYTTASQLQTLLQFNKVIMIFDMGWFQISLVPYVAMGINDNIKHFIDLDKKMEICIFSINFW